MNTFPALLGYDPVASGIFPPGSVRVENGACFLSDILENHNARMKEVWRLKGFVMMRDKREYGFVLLVRHERSGRCRFKNGVRTYLAPRTCHRWLLYALPTGMPSGQLFSMDTWRKIEAEISTLPDYYEKENINFSSYGCDLPYFFGSAKSPGYANT
jgi:hypothetical protein